MSDKIIQLQDGKRFVWTNGLIITEHGNPIIKEYDLTRATPQEIQSLIENPHQDSLLAEISKRG